MGEHDCGGPGQQGLAAAGNVDELLIQIAAARGALHAVAPQALADRFASGIPDSAFIRHRLDLLGR